MRARKSITLLLYKQCIAPNITTESISRDLYLFLTQQIKIQIPKSHTQKTKKTEKKDWQRAPTLQGDEDDKMLTHFMPICTRVLGEYDTNDEAAANNRTLRACQRCLKSVVEWRNAVHRRLPSTVPTKEALKLKHDDVAAKALTMHEAFRVSFGYVTPYLHACLHTHEHLQGRDLLDRTDEALEHLNKIIKQLLPLTSRRVAHSRH